MAVDPTSVALTVTQILDQFGIVHTIGGSIAASFAGEPRSSIAIDIVVALDGSAVPDLVAALTSDFYVDEDALQRAVRARSNTNLVHHATQLKIDLFIAAERHSTHNSWRGGRRLTSAADASFMSTRRRTSCCRSSGGTETAMKYRIVSGATSSESYGRRARAFDREYLTRYAPVLGVGDLLTRALRESE